MPSFGLPLLLAVQGAPDLTIGQTPTTIAGKDVVVLDIPNVDAAGTVHEYARDDIAWFLSATMCTSSTSVSECATQEVDQALLEEILTKLP